MKSQRPGNTGVNELLHRKRGEQFRHAQNVRNSRAHITSAALAIRNKPTLPLNITTFNDGELYETRKPEEERENRSSRSPIKPPPGPRAPKSWIAKLTTPEDLYSTSGWRLDALSLLYTQSGVSVHTQRVLPLSVLCLLPLITSCTPLELREDVLPFIPQHLRKEVVRYAAIHDPLSASRLFPMYEQEGHADGEIIVVGPHTSIPDDFFIRSNQESELDGNLPRQQGSTGGEEDWEDVDNSPKLLQTFAAVSASLSISLILSLPPTITHLALINISLSIPLHRLPRTCPLLVLLDLSYNLWLEHPSNETLKGLDRVDWARWSHLRTLGWRNCFVPDDMLVKLTTGRWDEVNVIR